MRKTEGKKKAHTFLKLAAKEKLEIKLSGASNFKGKITSPESNFNISGASKLTLQGNTIRCKIEVSGASKAALDNFPVNELKAEVSGAAKAQFPHSL